MNVQNYKVPNGLTYIIPCLILSVCFYIGTVMAEEFVPHSHIKKLEPGQKIANLSELNSGSEAVLQRLSERTYWVSIWGYTSLFYVGETGVLLFDPLSGGRANKLLDAIGKVTDLPVTMLVYSHSHLDHISDAKIILQNTLSRAEELDVVATQATLKEIKRFSLDLPIPNYLVSVPFGEFLFEDIKIQVFTPEYFAHTPDTSLFYMPAARVVQYVDVIQPGELPYFAFNFGMDPKAYEDTLVHALSLDWNYLSGGHGNIGDKRDIQMDLEYVQDVKIATATASERIKYSAFMNEETHSYDSFNNFIGALTDDVYKQLEGKYGSNNGLKPVLRSHVELIRIQQSLSQY